MFKGIGVCAGIGIGRAVLLREPDLSYAHVIHAGAEEEKARLAAAIGVFAEQTRAMAAGMETQVGSYQAEILLGQVMMMEDPSMAARMHERIEAGLCAEGALDGVCREYMQLFSAMEDEVMRQRAADVGDMRTRMLQLLLGRERADLAALPEGSVLVAHDLPPSMTAGLPRDRVAGILTEAGGATSHIAILARALGLPAVLGVPGVMDAVRDGDTIILDGGEGVAVHAPDEETLRSYENRRANWLAEQSGLCGFSGKPTKTKCGKVISLYGNIGDPRQAEQVMETTGEGVGLFRTEFLFLGRDSVPTEEEQFQAYRAAVQTMAGREVIIRTLDAGGDKDIPCLRLNKEENPFLGLRGIRLCLAREEVFRPQLRAILRASAFGRVKIMLPMVTAVEELRRARAIIEELKAELDEQGIPYDRAVKLGVMIETPAAALMADLLAQKADFFSIGTNDLTQYVMAADRGNRDVAGLGVPYQPAVLRCIRSVIDAGHRAGIPVGMCGEAAGDERMIPLLLAFGLEEFSVTPSAILRTRKAISGWSLEEARALTERVMACGTAEEVLACLKK